MNTDFFQQVLKFQDRNPLKCTSFRPIGGGCINSAVRLETPQGAFFLKWNSADKVKMFEKEALGLSLLKKKSSIYIPKIFSKGIFQDNAYLLLEWIERGNNTESFWHQFGRTLAKLHQQTNSLFGLDYDNFIGELPQINERHASWVDFFIMERLNPQIELALKNQLMDADILKHFDKLFNQLENLIPQEPPALVHGDLWRGNFMANQSSEPIIFDPAVHYGHRETELAFTKLFGGFEDGFYNAYHEEYPLEPGFNNRIDIHNLYSLLVHVNLFGTSYLPEIIRTLKAFT